ncbi:MAG: hypothetical protein QXP70_00640 [Methanomassiliicoccales archaeon]
MNRKNQREHDALKEEVTLRSPRHLPFTVSGPHSYFIGFTDLMPDSIGYHIKGEMNGLWAPPVRLFKNLSIYDGRKRLKVDSFSVLPWKRVFQLDGAKLEAMVPDDVLFFARIESTRMISTEIELKPLPVWLEDKNTEFNVSFDEKRSGIEIDFPAYGRRFGIRFGKGTVSLMDNIIELSSTGKTYILVEEGGAGTGLYRDAEAEKKLMSLHSSILSSSDLVTDSTEIDRAYFWSKLVLHWLSHSQSGIGTGITAGHPEFPWYFGFDTFLCIQALLDTGLEDVAAGSIEILTTRALQNHGRIPHEIITSGRVFNDGDIEESAMFPDALLKYYEWTHDIEFLRRHAQVAYQSLCFVMDRDLEGPGAMEDPERGRGKDIDTMCFFCEGVAAFERICSILNEDKKDALSGIDRIGELRSTALETRKIVEHDMWLPELDTYANRMSDGVPQFKGFWTSIMPFFCSIADKMRYKRFAESANGGLALICGKKGVRADTRGAEMPIQNGMMSLLALKYGDARNAERFFKYNMDALGRYSPCCVPEIINRKKGCYMQAWSSAMLVQPIINGFIGINVRNGVPVIEPKHMVKICRKAVFRRSRIAGHTYNIEVKIGNEENAEYEIKISRDRQ